MVFIILYEVYGLALDIVFEMGNDGAKSYILTTAQDGQYIISTY